MNIFSKYFINPEFQEAYENDGFVKIKLVPAEVLIELTDLYSKYSIPDLKTFTYSNFHNNKADNAQISDSIIKILSPYFYNFISGYKTVLGVFYIKPTGTKTHFYRHSDWTIVDERFYSSINIWLPLCTTNKENGNLVIFKKSHKNRLTLRGSPKVEYPRQSIFTQIKDRFNQHDIYTNQGEAVIFDHRIRHASRSNVSRETRIAVGISLIPKDAQLVHIHKDLDGTISMYSVPDDFYVSVNIDELDNFNSKQRINIINREYFRKQK